MHSRALVPFVGAVFVVLVVTSPGCETSGERLTRIRTHPVMTTTELEPTATNDKDIDRVIDLPDPPAPRRRRVVPRDHTIVTLSTGIIAGSSWHEIGAPKQDRRDQVDRRAVLEIVTNDKSVEESTTIKEPEIKEPEIKEPEIEEPEIEEPEIEEPKVTDPVVTEPEKDDDIDPPDESEIDEIDESDESDESGESDEIDESDLEGLDDL